MLFRSDRKSTRLNSSHTLISYAVFCLKKKKKCKVRDNRHLRCTVVRCLLPDTCALRSLSVAARLLSRISLLLSFCPLFFFFLKEAAPPNFSPFPPPPPFPI